MSAISLLLAELAGSTDLTALIGGKIYLHQLNQSEDLPQITLTDITDEPINDLNGEATTYNERIQIDVHTRTYGEAKTITDEVRTTLSAATGFSAVRQGTQKVKDLETNNHRWVIDFSIWYTTT